MMCLAVGFNVIREEIKPNSRIPQTVWHFNADAAFIPSLD